MNRYRYIDVLRGLAVLGVLAVHCAQNMDMGFSWTLNRLTSIGEKGVQLFFMLSAVTLMLSHRSRKLEMSKTSNFYLRRFFRIAPMYYLAIVFYNFIFNSYSVEQKWTVLSNFLFVHGFSPYWINQGVRGGWSIGVEMLFYLFFPLICIFVSNLNRAIVFTVFAFLLRIVVFLYFKEHPIMGDIGLWGDFLKYNFINQLPVFALGLILYFLIYDNDQEASGAVFLLLTVLVFFIVIVPVVPNDFSVEIALFMLVYSLAMSRSVILINTPLAFIGKLSFSIYLVHFPVGSAFDEMKLQYLFNHAAFGFFFFYLSVIAMSAVIASITYYGVERPMVQFCNRMIARKEGRME